MDGATRCAVVTGAATGIGRATAYALARDGYAVTLVGRRAGPLEELVVELRESGGDAIAAPADVTSREQAAAAVGAAVEHYGGIDVLVNNAGVGDSAPLLEESLERWEETLRINLTGAFLITQLALPHLIERR
ncbi:MAG: SDR family NAD(P)-dependent oxidoreductase, partial [Gaiellaceae bacterium]